MRYLWLLFDADDTLFDYPRAEAEALRKTLEGSGLGYRPDYLALYQQYNRQVWGELERGEVDPLELRTKRFRLFFNAAGLAADPGTISPAYLKNLAGCSQLFEGVPELLRTLAGRCHLAVVTNGLSEVQRPRLAASAIAPLIEKLFISEEIGAAKPDPAFFKAVFREIGEPAKAEVLIIGDSLTSDMQGGLNFGIDTCWYNPGRKAAALRVDHEIRELQELLAIT